MKRISWFLVLTLMFTTFSYAFSQTTPNYGIREKLQTTKAFINATIIQSSAKTISNGTLLIKDGRIIAVGDNIKIPSEAFIIDLKGYTVYPGFVDPFTDYGVEKTVFKNNQNAPIQFEAERIGGSAANNAIHAEINWVDNFVPDSKKSKELISYGYTAVLSARNDGIFRGQSFAALLGEGIPNDLIIQPYGPHYLSFNKGSSSQQYPNSLMGSIALIRQTFMDIDWYKKAHAAFRVNPDNVLPEFNSAIQSLAEDHQLPFIFDTDDELSLLRADMIAREFDLDCIQVGSGYEYARLNEIKETGATVILPLNFPAPPDVSTIEASMNVSLADLRHWETAPYNPMLLERENIPFCFTTAKSKDISSFFKNLRTAVELGLSEKTTLDALTILPAKIANVENFCGTIEPTKLANFIVTDGNIFNEKSSIYSVYINGIEQIVKTMPKADFNGKYNLHSDLFSAQLLLSSQKSDAQKYTGTLIIDSDTLSLSKINVLNRKIQFTSSNDSVLFAGTSRFSGLLANDTISGRLILANGDMYSWSAVKTIDSNLTAIDTVKNAKAEPEPAKRLARLTYPNKAYGTATLPPLQNCIVKNITVWTSEEVGILENHDIIFTGGKIADIGKNLVTPKGYLEIDGTGKHLTAGIIDAHSHIAISGDVNECTEAITAEVRISDVINCNDINIYRQLSGGVTTSQLIHGSCNAIGGQAQTIKLRWGENAEGLKYQNTFPTIKFALGENVKRADWGDRFTTRYPVTRMGIETLLRDEFQTALEYGRKWEAYNKLSKNEKITTIPPRKDLELDAVSEVINSKMDVHCHAYVQTEILMMMRLAEMYNFKIKTFIHILEGYKVADEMAEHGATGSGFSDWWAYKYEVYDAIPYNIALMQEKGVISSVNSDNADLARRLNQEAAKSIMYGDMSKTEAIKLATINPAITLNIDHEVGSIKVGKSADVVIWNGDPLSIYSKVEQTWIEGRKYFDINNAEETLIAEEKNQLIQKILNLKSEKHKDFKPNTKSDSSENSDQDSLDNGRSINETN